MNDKQQLAAIGKEILQHIRSEADKDKHPATMRVYQSDIPALMGVNVGKPTMSISDLVNGRTQPLCMAKRIEELEAQLAEKSIKVERLREMNLIAMKRVDGMLDRDLELSRLQSLMSEGWQLVPVNPTPEMEEQGGIAYWSGETNSESILKVWNAMLGATPKLEGGA